MENYKWDVFISHASEDKEAVATPLFNMLKTNAITVWLDQYEISLGDSLQTKIDEGLSKSRFGVVILSKQFFSKTWTQKELSALFSKEESKQKVILPVWHNVDFQDVVNFSPLLASKLAVTTKAGLEKVADEILKAISPYILEKGIHKIRLSQSEINNLREQIKWKRYHEGSYSNFDPLLSIMDKFIFLEEGNFKKGDLNVTELKLLLKIATENKNYVDSHDYGPLTIEEANKLRKDATESTRAIIDKLRYCIQVNEIENNR